MTVTPEAMQQAQRALKVFRGLQPVLTTYARILTGRPDVRVVASETSNGSTDGTKIFYRPPLSLGRNADHEKWNCNKRGEYGIQLCPACADHEQILSTVYHEIAHIWKESFAETSDYDRRKVIDHAIAEYGTKYADEIRRRIEAAPYSARTTYSGLATLISPFLKSVVNALEDARINQELFRAHPGAITIFAAKTQRIFAQGVEQLDHETGEFEHKAWKDYPLNSQIVCGLLCMACGYDYSNWFHPAVVDALNDEKLQELVKKTGLLGSMSEVYAQAFPVLARLRELGYCRLEQDPEDEEEPEPEPEQSQPEEPDEQPEQGDPGDDDPGEGEPQERDGQGSGDDNEEPGEQEAEPGSGEPDGEGDEAQDADDGDESASSGPGEDQQGSDDSPGGDDSGETDTDNGTDEAQSESDSGEPGESGEAGDVGDEDSTEAQGSAGTGSEAEGSAGSGDGDQELGGDGPDEGPRDGGSDPSGSQSLAEGPGGPNQDEPGDSEAEAGDDPELGNMAGGDPPGDGTDVPAAGDADPDLGGSEGLDPSDGEPAGEDPDGPPGGDDGEGEGAGGGPDSEDGGEPEPVDTGPFSHGTTVNVDESQPEPEPTPDMGTPEDAEAGLTVIADHEPPHEIESDGTVIDEQAAMKTAIIQGTYFETPSAFINEIHEYEFPPELYDRLPHECPGITEGNGKAWVQYGSNLGEQGRIARGIDGDWSVPESVIAPSLLKARIVFSENLRGKTIANLKSGKVSSRHLGKRAPVDDERMMRRRLRPSRRDYFVLIGIDVSQSTEGKNLVLAKQLAMAEAELLKRLNVNFAVVAHSGKFVRKLERIDIHYYWIKKPDEKWDARVKTRLEKLGCDLINLDGHSLEFYRKILDRRRETDRVIHYYTDGAMPAANFAEELEVLQREIKICRQKGYILRGIGIRTDSPRQHGLETIELHEQADILLVIKDLEKQLMGR